MKINILTFRVKMLPVECNKLGQEITNDDNDNNNKCKE